MQHNFILLIIDENFRWNRAKGDTIDSSDTNWYSGEPDITGFDYSIRETSPITNESYRECTSNPVYDCSVSESFKCTQEADTSTSKTPKFQIGDIDTSSFCDSSCATGAINNLFVSFDLVKATTNDATPACMALLGPSVNDAALKESDYDQCSLLFDFEREEGKGVESYDYAKWIDLKCNQRSRALMCSTLGKFVMINNLSDIRASL